MAGRLPHTEPTVWALIALIFRKDDRGSIVERSPINGAKPQASRTATLKHLGSIIKPHVPQANFALKGIPTGKWPFSEAVSVIPASASDIDARLFSCRFFIVIERSFALLPCPKINLTSSK
ncbi:hypothetical protein FQN52_001575 [Onygenales sp. PD_12]|nr:hypothetical protein FQN52_001575 [Onygenales sp. PD_12]